MNYWRECVEEALEDAKLVATDEQIDTITVWVEGGHDNYRQAMGLDIASKNLRAHRENELQKVHDELRREREKVMCRTCNGSGRIITHGPTHSSDSPCWKCDGDGRHSP